MEERLKQRLVGAVVLVSLAVVFVPILFDIPGEVNEETSTIRITEIPERPRDGFGSPVNDTLDAPRTVRLDAEVERERDRNASEGAAGEPGASSRVLFGDSTSNASSASTPVARSEPAPAVARPDDGSDRKQAVEASAARGWTVQLGSFLKSENALALRKRLQAGGYPAFVESGTSAQGKVSRVFVGPMSDREQAVNSATKLRREMELKGIVVPYPGG